MLHSQFRKFLPVALAIFCIALMEVAVTRAQDTPTPEQVEDYRRSLDRLDREGKGTVQLGGEIVDDEGRPLSDVTLRIRASRPKLLDPFDEGYSRKVKVVTRAFRYKCSRCSTVHLRFSKEGYHYEELEFVYDRKQHGKKLKATALRITLGRIRNPVALVEIGGEMTIGAGSVRVIPISLKPAIGSVHLELLVEKAKKDGFLEQLEYLKLEAQLNADGTPVTVLLDQPDLPKHRQIQPVSAFLDFSMVDGGGAVLYEPTETEQRRIFNSMRMAPESGYVPQVPLGRLTGNQVLFFYCKIGGYYGKGMVRAPRLLKINGLKVSTHVSIWLNRDGGRSVESRYH